MLACFHKIVLLFKKQTFATSLTEIGTDTKKGKKGSHDFSSNISVIG